jgi:hypothetical protein
MASRDSNKKRKHKKIGSRAKSRRTVHSPQAERAVALYTQQHSLKRQLEEVFKHLQQLQERLEDGEIHINLLTRLITTLCVEKMGMRVGVLKRLLKRIEKEAIRDSQILHLESLYKLPPHPDKKNPSGSSQKNDPWEDIS